jgi:uncharacterized membrane protein YozB (DUF420 family)
MVALGPGESAMTPTLVGRWQTRLALLATLGLLITVVFVLLGRDDVFLRVLLYVAVFGVAWDVLYIALQRLRWDRDWPAAFQVLNGLTEGAFIFVLATVIGLPGLPRDIPLALFAVHYGLVWLAVFLWTQGPMRAIFPFWRFHGGTIRPRVPSDRSR